MAIVAVYEFENGVKCAINDACYAGKRQRKNWKQHASGQESLHAAS